MPYLIDGHNLIPHLPGVDLKDLDDEMVLIEQLRQFSHRDRVKIEVYFDRAPPGQTRKQSFGFVTAFFISRDQTADAAIHIRLQQLGPEAKNWTVVSSDREVRQAAKVHQARVSQSAAFAARLGEMHNSDGRLRNPKWDPTLSKEEVEYWRRRFLDNDR